MRQLILHIGRSKTGTTTWQRTMSSNREALARQGILVPAFLSSENHAELAVAFSAQPGRLARAFAVDGPQDQQALRKQLDRRFRQHITEGVWLFSSEHLSTRLRTSQEIDSLCEFLTPHFDRIDVIAYVRRPDDLAPSAFAETVKAGRTHPFNAKYVQQSRSFFDHGRFADMWSRPHDSSISLNLRPYLRDGLIEDILRTIGEVSKIDLLANANLIIPTPTANESLSALALRYLQEINPLFPDGGLTNRSRRALISALAQHQGPRLQLSPAVAEALVAEGFDYGGLPEKPDDPRWRAWFEAPCALVGQWPKLDDPTRTELEEMCRRAGVDPAGSDPGASGSGLTGSAQRTARRAAVRLTRW